MYQVKTRNVPRQQILGIKKNVTQPQLGDFLMTWMPGIAEVLDKAGVRHSTHSFVIYHGAVTQDSDGPVEVCMTFEGKIAVPPGMAVRVEDEHEEAYATISKAQCEFPAILEAYDAVGAFVKGNGWEMLAAPREEYFVDANAIGPDDPFVDIAWPVSRAKPGVSG